MNCVLEVTNIAKSFPGVQALEGVSLRADRGQVHAVTGENGAGKSTLMKILAGIDAPDSGEIVRTGRIAMIHQELLTFPDLTVAENICMGREPTRWFPGWIDRPAMHHEAAESLERLGGTISTGRKMRELRVAEMQTVEIAKALACQADMIIMDEPTSAISEREVEALFAVIRDLKRRGVAVIYISHKLNEIFGIADVVTVLRDGRHVATHDIGDLDENKLIALMVGRELSGAGPRPAQPSERAGQGSAPLALEVLGLGTAGKFRDVSFAVRRGEILGIAGLMGAGRTELASAIFGLAPAERGEIRINGRSVRITRPADAIANGIAMVTEDRKEYGLVPNMSVKHNITLGWLRFLIDHSGENKAAGEQIRAFAIKTSSRDQQVTHLSGGNQQKVVIAKALLADPAILILDEPTRGIDIGAKAEVYAIMRRLASEGKAIIMVSSELTEILSMSDRILVMREGAVTAELNPHATTQEEVLRYASY